MPRPIHIHKLSNGLTLIAEPMEWLESAAFALLLPAGCSRDPVDRPGLSNFTCEMVQRGAGQRTNRQFVEALEDLGVDHSASVSNSHTSYGAAMLSTNLYEALTIHADLVRRPQLPPQQMPEGLQVCLQELRTIEDDLSQKMLIELRARHYPDPWGRSAYGTAESLSQTTMQHIREFHRNSYSPNGTIIGVAGKLDWPRLREQVDELFGDWEESAEQEIKETHANQEYFHIQHDSSQTHIGVAYSSVPYNSPDYYQARGAVGVLSDGMSSRLFTEIREKRGLCYSVFAAKHSLRDRGCVLCYAGTSTERAQQTLDVLIAELQRLSEGIQQDELDRLKARVKSALIMQQESSRARAGSIATDWFLLGRVQTLDEVGSLIDGLTCRSINDYLAKHPPAEFNVVTLGAQPLEMPRGIS